MKDQRTPNAGESLVHRRCLGTGCVSLVGSPKIGVRTGIPTSPHQVSTSAVVGEEIVPSLSAFYQKDGEAFLVRKVHQASRRRHRQAGAGYNARTRSRVTKLWKPSPELLASLGIRTVTR